MKDSMGVGGSYGEPYNPERGDANSVVEEWVAVGRFMAKENEKAMRDFPRFISLLAIPKILRMLS